MGCREREAVTVALMDDCCKIVKFLKALLAMSHVKVVFYDNGQVHVTSQYALTQDLLSSPPCRTCCDSLLYKGSKDDIGLELEVTGWVWNKMKSTKAMMMQMRTRVSCSMIAVRLRLWEVDKRTV
jgi:hypothetical protein